MEQHLSSLQDVVRLTIRQELTWSEQRFKRVTMSQDADGKPAELYGADGKIYYRKAGGAGVEIGAGVGLWYSTGTRTRLIVPQEITLEEDVTIDHDHLIKWKEPVSGDLVGSVYGFHGGVQRDFMIKSYNSGILTFDSAAGYSSFSGNILSDVGTPAAGTDAANKTYVDGVSGLWVDDTFFVKLTTPRAVDMQGAGIKNVLDVRGSWGSDLILYGSNWTDDGDIGFLKWDHAQEILETSSIILRLDYDNVGAGVNTGLEFNRGSTAGDAAITWDEANDQFEFAAVNGSVYAPLSAAYLKMWSEPAHKAGTIQINNTTGNMEFTDTITGTKTLAELVGGGAGLWQDTGYTNLITPDAIDMQGFDIVLIGSVTGGDNDPVTPTFAVDAITGHDIRLLAPSGQTAWIFGGGAVAIGATGSLVGVYQNLIMATGKYIKADTGDLEFRVATGSSIKFTAV